MELGTVSTVGQRRRAGAAAWLAVIALLIQALLPAAALAAQSRAAGEQIVVCTLAGVKTVTVGGHETKGGKSFAGLPCADCLAATTSAVPAPELGVEPAVYAAARIDHAPERRWAPQVARAPPRPPGQGPPLA